MTNKPLDADEGQIFEVRMKASEAKEHQVQKIRFETSVEFNEKPRKVQDKHLFLRINELVMGKVSPLMIPQDQEKATFDHGRNIFRFPKLEFMSD